MTLPNKNEQDLTSGPLYRVVMRLAWPIIAATFLQFALGITDFFWIGWLGPEQQDAMTSSLIVVWSVFAVMAMITIGVNAIVARHFGAGEMRAAGFIARQGIKLALISGFLLSVLGYFVCPSILAFMQAEPAVQAYGVSYLRVFFAATPALFFAETVYAVYRASGNTRTPMYVSLMGVGLNIILDPILIFGWGPFPELGIAGAAWATFISLFVDVGAYIFLLSRKGFSFPLSPWKFSLPTFSSCRSIMKIGLPISTHHLVFMGVYAVILQTVHKFGAVAGAAMGVGNRLESINYLVCSAIALATSSIVAQNLGAGKPERAAGAAWAATQIGIGFALVTTVIFLFFPSTLASAFTNDPRVIELASDYLIILGLTQTLMAVEIIIDGAFSGAGDTIPPMLIFIPGSILRIPLAHFMAITLDMGLNGVWWTFSITTVLKGALLAYWFSRGKWKLRKLAN